MIVETLHSGVVIVYHGRERISAIEGKSKLCGDLSFTMLDIISLPASTSSTSTLFAQDGASTGMHRDVLPSWSLHYGSEAVGSKVILFPAPGANMLEFKEQGEDGAAEVRVVILEAGDYLIMLTPIPHTMLTMGDTWMCHAVCRFVQLSLGNFATHANFAPSYFG